MNHRIRVNLQITAPRVHLIDEQGKSHGEVPIEIARSRAAEAGLDLIEVNAVLQPPLVKILEFGKFKYELNKKDKDNRRHHKAGELKELRFGLKTEAHDRTVKLKKAAEFIQSGHKVQITIILRGREQQFMDVAFSQLTDFIAQLKPLTSVKIDKSPERLGNRVYSIVAKG